MRILLLTNLLPWPLDNGGKIKTYTVLQGLKKGGHVTDLVCFSEKSEPDPESEAEILKLCDNVKQIHLKLTTAENKAYMTGMAVRSLVSRYSLGVYKYKSGAMKEVLGALAVRYRYDLVYYDHLQLCIYKPTVKSLGIDCRDLLDEHNCEALIMKRNMGNTRNPVKKIFLFLEFLKLCRFETKSIKGADKCIILSEEDYAALRHMCKCEFEHGIVPIGVADRGMKKDAKASCINILFVGTLTWEPNNSGAVWFLKNVVPLLEKKKIDFTLYVVGKNPGNELRALAGGHGNVFLTGYVDSVDVYYDMCQCMVVPLFVGSGQRVKIIEAFSKGMPVISTSVGAEGLEFVHNESGLVADTPEAFAECIMAMENEGLRKKIAVNARRKYEENYSAGVIQNKVLKYISE